MPAQIIGTPTTGTNTAALPTGATDNTDHVVVFSYRSGSATPPTLPTGWTNITSRSSTPSMRVQIRQKTSAWSAMPTFTNATRTVAILVRGLDTTPVGNPYIGGGTNQNIVYPGGALTKADGLGLILRGAVHTRPDATIPTPANHTSLDASGTAPGYWTGYLTAPPSTTPVASATSAASRSDTYTGATIELRGLATPLSSSVTDNFDDGVVSTPGGGFTYGAAQSETGGRLRLTSGVDATTGWITGTIYDFDSMAVQVFRPAGGAGGGSEALVERDVDGGTRIVIAVTSGHVVAQTQTGYNDPTAVQVAVDTSNGVWVRMRLDGADLVYEYSLSGTSWTNIRTITAPAWLTDNLVRLGLQYSGYGATAQNYGEFDNLNLAPVVETATSTPLAITATSTAAVQNISFVAGARSITATLSADSEVITAPPQEAAGSLDVTAALSATVFEGVQVEQFSDYQRTAETGASGLGWFSDPNYRFATVAVSTDQAHSGTQSWKMTMGSNDAEAYAGSLGGAVAEGDIVTYGLWLYTPDAGGGYVSTNIDYTLGGVYAGGVYGQGVYVPPNVWTFHSIQITIPAGVDRANPVIDIAVDAGWTSGETLYWDDVSFTVLSTAEGVVQDGSGSLPLTAGLTAAATRVQSASATLAITATRTANSARTQHATGSLPLTANQTAVSIRTQHATGSLAVTATRTSAGVVVESAVADLDAVAVMTAAGATSKIVTATLGATASPSASSAVTRPISASRTITASLSADSAVIRGADADLDVVAGLATSSGVSTLEVQASRTVTAGLSADGVRTTHAAATRTVTAALSAQAQVFRGGGTSSVITATMTSEATVIRSVSAQLPVTATLEASSDTLGLHLAQGTLALEAIQTASATRIASTGGSQATTASLSASGTRSTAASGSQVVTATLHSSGTRVQSASATLAVTAGLAADTLQGETQAIEGSLPITAALSAVAEVATGTIGHIQAVVQMSADASVVRSAAGTLAITGALSGQSTAERTAQASLAALVDLVANAMNISVHEGPSDVFLPVGGSTATVMDDFNGSATLRLSGGRTTTTTLRSQAATVLTLSSRKDTP